MPNTSYIRIPVKDFLKTREDYLDATGEPKDDLIITYDIKRVYQVQGARARVTSWKRKSTWLHLNPTRELLISGFPREERPTKKRGGAAKTVTPTAEATLKDGLAQKVAPKVEPIKSETPKAEAKTSEVK